MKVATIIKTGYSSGIYGCSGEYFTCIFTSKNASKGLMSFKFNGMYGVEDRVAEAMRNKGYTMAYCQADYGKLTRKDIMKNNYSEHIVINNIDELLSHGYIDFDK